MTAEPGQHSTEWENVPRPTTQQTPAAQPIHYSTARHGSHVEESPELLRWRADLLMDEMMMGGVDVSAADGNRTFSGVDTPVLHRPQPSANTPFRGSAEHATHENYRDYPSDPTGGYPAKDQGPAHPYRNGDYSNGGPVNGSGRNGDGNNYAGDRHYSASGGTHAATPLDSNGTYPSPSASSHFVNEPPRPADPRPVDSRAYDAGYSSSHFDREARFDDAQVSDPRVENPRGAYNPYPRTPDGVGAPSYDDPQRMAPSSDTSYSTGPYPNERAVGDRYTGYPQPSTGDTYAGESRDPRAYSYDEPQRPLPSQPSLPPSSPPSAMSSGQPAQAPANYGPSAYETRYEDVPQDGALRDRGISAPRRYPVEQRDPQIDATRYAGEGFGQPAPREDVARPARPMDEPPAQSSAAPNPLPPLRTTMDGLPGASSEQPRSDRLYSVEQQYEQFRREQSANAQPAEPPRAAVRPPLPPVEPPRTHVAPPRVTPPPVDEQTKWATGPDKWEYQDFSVDPNAPQEESLFDDLPPLEPRPLPSSGVRHDPAEFVSAMSVVGNKKRSTLLPRSTELDIDTLNREISDLHGEIAALLPVGNETSERARHLLDKAYSILQSDPSRSAEVEYYMQQVRTIVQRLHQSRQWSDLYRKRLRVYLLGWLGLSAMVLVARFLFQMDIEDALVWVTGVSWDSWLVAHWAAFVGTTGAGAFGGALGALYTMYKHARGEYSFFDRKYGLRGLILPFMGLFVAAFGYVIFGIVFALVGINPAENLTASIVPTMAAFAFGFNQESIYGTRN